MSVDFREFQSFLSAIMLVQNVHKSNRHFILKAIFLLTNELVDEMNVWMNE